MNKKGHLSFRKKKIKNKKEKKQTKNQQFQTISNGNDQKR